MRVAIASIFFLNGASSAYRNWKLVGRSQASTTASASSAAPGAAGAEAVVDGGQGAGLAGQALHERELLGGVLGPLVDGDDRLDAELADVLDVLREVLAAGLDQPHRLGRGLGLRQAAAAVHAERAHGRDDDHRVRAQVAGAADDVHELLHAQVGREAGLRDQVLAELQAEPVGDDRVVAVRDVGERGAVHQARLALEGLDQVRLDRVLEHASSSRRRSGSPRPSPAGRRTSGRS